jgi:hypothetical protein
MRCATEILTKAFPSCRIQRPNSKWEKGFVMVTFADGGRGQPTLEQIFCLYLYDSLTPPPPGTLKKRADVMALKKLTRQIVEINMDWFMKYGGGRFVNIARFKIVRDFLTGMRDGKPDGLSGMARTFTTKGIFDAYGVPNLKPEDRQLGLKQYEYDINNSDFTDRCEVFGSSSFQINADAMFIVYQDGRREIRNVCAEPVEDNYNYESTSWQAKISNLLTEHAVDPWGIGVTVPIRFTGKVSYGNGLFYSLKGFELGRPKPAEMLWIENVRWLNEQVLLLESTNISWLRAGANFFPLHFKKMDRLRAGNILYAKFYPGSNEVARDGGLF